MGWLFTDSLVILNRHNETMEKRLEKGRECLKRGGFKLSKTKIKNPLPNNDSAKMKIIKYVKLL